MQAHDQRDTYCCSYDVRQYTGRRHCGTQLHKRLADFPPSHSTLQIQMYIRRCLKTQGGLQIHMLECGIKKMLVFFHHKKAMGDVVEGACNAAGVRPQAASSAGACSAINRSLPLIAASLPLK